MGSPGPDEGYPEDEGEGERRRWKGKGRGGRRGRNNRDSRDDGSETDASDILAGLKLWEDLDTGLPEVLPTELLGWLMLRRCGLTAQQRLNVLSAVGNSLKAEDIERGLRGAEDELRLHDREQHPKGSGKKGRPLFWVEHGGEWAILSATEDDMEEWMQDVHWVGSSTDLASSYGVNVTTSTSSSMASGGHYDDDGGIWFQELDGSHSWWDLDPTSGEYYHQDAAGAFWSLTDWESMQYQSYFSEDQQKELADAFAAYEGKLRSFTESRNLVYNRNANRGFFSNKGKNKGKGKGKSRPMPSSSTGKGVRPTSSTSTSASAMAAVGSPNYTGCFICGSSEHDFRHCPRRNGGGKKGGKPGNIYVVDIGTVADTENETTMNAPEEINRDTKDETFSDEPEEITMDTKTEMISEALDESNLDEFDYDMDPETTSPTQDGFVTNIYALQAMENTVDMPSVVPNFIGHVAQPDLEGYAVLDTGATETITSLEALEFVINKRRQRFVKNQYMCWPDLRKCFVLEMDKFKLQKASC